MSPRIALVGQMAAGKSSVGRALAERLGVAFVDLDEAIVARAGRSIEAIFALDGEAAFRALEREELTRQLGARPGGLVLATGGGAPCQPGAMTELSQHARVVWLRARPETLASRANGGAGRPLLAGKNLERIRSELAAQLVERHPFYALAALTIDVDALTIPATVALIVERLGLLTSGSVSLTGSMTSTPPSPSPHPAPVHHVALSGTAPRSYPIYFPEGGFGPALQHALTAHVPKASRALVVTDSNVGPLYAAAAEQAVTRAGLDVEVLTVAAGEASKSLSCLSTVLDTALGSGLTRSDVLVALGGGVVGDLTGLASALLNRGTAVVQVPTSLLAQVDSSVGGKTAINHATGKNLIGAFWQPQAVVASQAVLATLPAREVRGGLAEALKHGFIADPTLLTFANAHADALRALDATILGELIRRCCVIKAAVVAADELDKGQRAVLNFGHTFGHAFERLEGYGALTHGEAVGLGMVLAARVSARAGNADQSLESEIVATLVRHGLPAEPDALGHSPAELVTAARSDKKADASGVRFILLDAIGEPRIQHIPWQELQEWVA